jgi:hypothetical protein
MKLKIFTCPECKFKKFESINALNVHIGKSHSVNYKISIVNNKPVRKLKTRATVQYVSKINELS